jgi:YrbI family 3-deoxy-D-manno-octulosonate 8-phosphate phosphatase
LQKKLKKTTNHAKHNTVKFQSKCKRIKIVLTDVDGVLTNSSQYYSKNGEVLKRFHVRDGMGINILRRKNIPTIIVTKEKSVIVKKWAKKMNVRKVMDGIIKKETIVKQLIKEFNFKKDEFAYIGDDVNDIQLLKIVGFSACPADGDFEVKNIVDYVCCQNGGQGAFREIIDLIMSYQFPSEKRY